MSILARKFTTKSFGTLKITPLTPKIGAIVHDVDLRLPVDVASLQQALVHHHVLFFRGQNLSAVQLRDVGAKFGALHKHPLYPNHKDAPEIIILDTDDKNPPDNDNWHTDVTFIQTPPLGAVLQAIQIPPGGGGDTCWASAADAFDALSAPLRHFLEPLTATHDITKAFPLDRWGAGEQLAHYEEVRKKHPPVVHPVIRVHPVTGRRGLFVNEGFTTRINELSANESTSILNVLFAHVSRPDFTVRWHWSVGDVAFWDNRLTQHYALADYLPHRRIMHRATILGDQPRGPA